MSSRIGMAWIIALLRTKINDTASAIWTDDELEDYLDMHRIHVRRESLDKDAGGKVYYSKYGVLEDDVELYNSPSDSAAKISPSVYSANLVDGVFTFSSSQENNYYLDAKSYNIEGAIAECLEQIAMDPEKTKSFSRGSIKMDQYDLLEMAKYHRMLAGTISRTVRRTYRK